MPQTRFVTRKALALGIKPILVVNKIDRVGCDPEGSVDATFDLFCALGASDAQLDFPIVYASGREGWAVEGAGGPAQGSGAAARPDRRGRAAARRRRGSAAGDARDDARLRRLPRLRRHRPHRIGTDQARRARAVRAQERRARGVPRREAARLPVAQALRAGRGDRGRHLRRDRHAGPDGRRDDHRDRAPDHPAAARDRRADGQDAVHVQQRAVRGQGGEIRHLPQPARPPVEGSEVERRAARRGDRVARHLRRARPRRAAPVGADRDHAPRGLRGDGVAAAGHLQRGRRRAAGAVRRGRHRPRRGVFGRGHRGARPSRRAHAGDGAGGRRPDAARIPVPGARAHRLPLPVPHRHARDRPAAPQLQELRAVRGPRCARGRTAC